MTCGCGGPCCAEAATRGVRANAFGWNVESIGHDVGPTTFHVFSLRIDGSFTNILYNHSPLPLLRTQINNYRAALQGFEPFLEYRKSLGLVWGGATRKITTTWSVSGPLDVLWAFINILFTGSANVVEHLDVQALGYHKVWDQEIRVPIRIQDVHVEWN